MFCVNCGKEVSDDSEFCPFCGQATVEKKAEEANTAGEGANSNVFEKIQGSIMERLKVFPKRFQIAIILAVVSTVFWILYFIASRLGAPKTLINIFSAVANITPIITYVCAGLVSAIKITWNVIWKAAKWGWFLVPVFPFDLFIGFIALGAALMVMILVVFILPIIPVSMSLKEEGYVLF